MRDRQRIQDARIELSDAIPDKCRRQQRLAGHLSETSAGRRDDSGTKHAAPHGKAVRQGSLRLGTLHTAKAGVGVDLDALSGQDDGARSHVVANHQCTVHWEVTAAYANATAAANLLWGKDEAWDYTLTHSRTDNM